MSTIRRKRGGLAKVWGAPIALAVLGAAGLVAALLGDGVLDALSWLLLSVPLAVVIWYVAKRRR